MNSQAIDISIVLYVKLFGGTTTKSYLLDSGRQSDDKNRISVYMTNALLYFSVIDRTGKEHSTSVPVSKLADSFHMLVFELTNTDDKAFITIYSGIQKIAATESPIPLFFTNNPIEENYFVGADRMGEHSSECEIADQLIYQKTLTEREKSIIYDHLLRKHKDSPKNPLLFTKGAFLYRNKQSNTLVQPDAHFRPQYANAAVI